MKIVYYSKPCFGDCDFPLIKALMDKGQEVITIYPLSPYGLKTTIFNIDKQIPTAGIFKASVYPELAVFEKYMSLDNVYISNEPTGKFCLASIAQELRAFRFILNQKADIVHLVEDPSPLFALLLWIVRKKLVVTIHDGRPHMGKSSRKGLICRKMLKLYVKRFILLNKEENTLFEKGYGINPDYIFNSHLGYYEILKMYGSINVPKQNYILFFGRVSQYKGIDYLLEAMKLVHLTHPNTVLIIAGSGKYHFNIEEYQALDYIEFRNRYIGLDELANLIRGAKFTVCPYIEATQSGVVYSSFALNTPVIATNVGGLPEMIDSGVTGIIVPPKNTEKLSNAIKELLTDRNLLDMLSQNIKKSSNTGKGSWAKIADDYINVYKN